MRRLSLAIGLAACLLLSAGRAEAQTACSIVPQSTLMGYFADNAPSRSIIPAYVRNLICTVIAQAISVRNTTDLRAASTASYPWGIWRLGYGSPGDSGEPLFYAKDTGSVCTTDDGGDCVAASGGGYWLAQFPASGVDPRWYGAQCGSSDSTAALQSAATYLSSSNGGTLWVPCPLTVAGEVQLSSGTALLGNSAMYNANILSSTWPATSGPAINCTSTSAAMCIRAAGRGIRIAYLAMGNPLTTPPGSGSWSPTVYPFNIGTVDTDNWAGLQIDHIAFVASSQCIDLEGSPDYTTVGIAGSQWLISDIWSSCFNSGIVEHDVDNTGRIQNLDEDFWWNRGVASLTAYVKAHKVGVLWHYAANTVLSNVEFFADYKAIDQQNDHVSGGFGVTLAAANIQGSNISFNEVCQAMGNESGAALISSGSFTNVTLYQDTTQTPYCALNSPAAIDVSSTGSARWSFSNTKAGYVQTLAAVGAGSGLHFHDLDVQQYSWFSAGSPAFKVSSGADFLIDGSLMSAIRPATGAGNLIGPGLDSTQGYSSPICVGGGTNGTEGSVCLTGSGSAASTSGYVSYYLQNGTRAGFTGFGTSAGLNVESDIGSIFLRPLVQASGTPFLYVGATGSGGSSSKLIVNVSGLPTSCTGIPSGSLWSNAGVVNVC